MRVTGLVVIGVVLGISNVSADPLRCADDYRRLGSPASWRDMPLNSSNGWPFGILDLEPAGSFWRTIEGLPNWQRDSDSQGGASLQPVVHDLNSTSSGQDTSPADMDVLPVPETGPEVLLGTLVCLLILWKSVRPTGQIPTHRKLAVLNACALRASASEPGAHRLRAPAPVGSRLGVRTSKGNSTLRRYCPT